MKENYRMIRKFPHKNVGRTSALESHGPDGKNRGTLQQLMDRYIALGKEAAREGDLVISENFFQHADHYRRLSALFAKRAPVENTTSQESALTQDPLSQNEIILLPPDLTSDSID
jgi:hypothetical protein